MVVLVSRQMLTRVKHEDHETGGSPGYTLELET